MPSISGYRRRGYTPEAIRKFCERIGVAKANSTVDIALLEHTIREDLNRRAARVWAFLRPLKVVIENYPQDQTESLEAVNNPEDDTMGTRMVPFSRVLYIEQDDFMENPPKKFFRLAPGREVRLRYAYFITCREAIKDPHTGARSLNCAAPTTRPPGAATHPTAARSKPHSTGFRRSMPWMPRSGSTTGFSPKKTRMKKPTVKPSRISSIPTPLKPLPGASWSPAWPTPHQATSTSSNAWDIFVPMQTTPPLEIRYSIEPSPCGTHGPG
jgi:glutamyl/glutaminyl-tRNA synthetase